MSGTLYVVATPIGNLEDITLRALRILREVDCVACEDTRTTGKLLARYDLQKKLMSYHEHNEERRTPEFLALLEEGKSIALVTDAGTPTISDPGYRLIREASLRGIAVVPIPGPSAIVAALSVSGLSTRRFAFLGFPERSENRKKELLESIRPYPETLVFFESPKRVLSTLRAMLNILGDRNAALCRELTKIHEETIRGRLSELISQLEQREEIRGEVTIVIEGYSGGNRCSKEDICEMLTAFMKQGKTLKDAVSEVGSKTGLSRREVYKLALGIWGK